MFSRQITVSCAEITYHPNPVLESDALDGQGLEQNRKMLILRKFALGTEWSIQLTAR